MALLPPEPWEVILRAMVADIATVDWPDWCGLEQASVRHARNRDSVEEERPGVAVAFVADRGSDADLDLNAWEKVRELEVDLVLDAALATELSDLDPTANLVLGRMANASMRAMRAQLSQTGQLVDWIRRTDVVPDDRSTSDAGRLVCGVIVVYRVRSDDESVLLAVGQQA